jgi:uncharacterized protein
VRLLLDVNVWVALFDDAHIQNAQARKLFKQPKLKIATCALTENGVLRVLNLPGYAKRAPPGFELVRQKLVLACADIDHEFWPCSLSLRNEKVLDWTRIMGHNQITDAYLLALAVEHEGALATFDHGVALSAVSGAAAKHLRLL